MRLASGVASLIVASSVSAHTLETSTARLTLRDGHLEVHAEWELFALLGEPPTSLAVMPEAQFEQVYSRARARVRDETVLEVDAQRAELVVTQFPEPPQLRLLAATASARGHDHALVQLRLESAATWAAPRTVGFQPPPSLGPVLTTFAQPQTRLVEPGARASFVVLEAPASRRTAAPVGVLAALALISLVVTWRERRRT